MKHGITNNQLAWKENWIPSHNHGWGIEKLYVCGRVVGVGGGWSPSNDFVILVIPKLFYKSMEGIK